MSESRIPSDWKQCCTCEYWAGQRDVYNNGSYVLLTTVSGDKRVEGKCLKQGSGWTGQGKLDSCNCAKWEKWRVLK